jgi:glyoxylase-like metal-dependent hydrolase (beta-lactamase superfamily II)
MSVLARLPLARWTALLSAALPLAAVLSLAAPVQAADTVASVRLYTIDCGRIEVSDMAAFSDTGEYDGKPGKLTAPCFLIRHPKGNLLWDTGLGDGLADKKDGLTNGPFHLSLKKTLAAQLADIGIQAADINFVSFSHLHFDHTGNANNYAGASWLVAKNELDWGNSTPTPFGVNPDSFSAYKTAKLVSFAGDKDVFDDGSVRILAAPGHTPGHKVLMLKLKKSGTVILSGDLYHTMENRKEKRMPLFNTGRAETLASIDRIERIIKNTHARFVIQHAPESFDSMPKFPAYLD